jgi:Ca2+-binding RTX toxin-like protein
VRSQRWLAILTVVTMLTSGSSLPFAPPTIMAQAPIGADFALDARDLRFIFRQIQIAQAHAAGGQLLGSGANQVNEARLPFGLRTVDGSFNHLGSGQTRFGAADQRFPRLTSRVLRDVPGPSSYADVNGPVTDPQPRIISNLIVDQTENNPAAAAAAAAGGELTPSGAFFIPNVAPDVGLSAPFNSMFTFFGQFFDHGLDLVNKGGSGTVFVPLQSDDPLFVPGGPTNFMVLTRATHLPGLDGVVGTPDDINDAVNQTTPFVDQNQTYTSHPSHQVFLRDYEMRIDLVTNTMKPRSTGKMADGIGGHIANWGEVKSEARTKLGIQLVDTDVFNVPLLLTDPYGRFIPAANGFPQIVTSLSPLTTVPGDPAANGGLGVRIPQGAPRTGHAFLDDIAHAANPANGPHNAGLLADHFVTGDGRGNENIALTAVHTIFHSEHNRLATQIGGVNGVGGLIDTLLTPTEAAAWRAVDAGSGWDYGERVFQAARFVTEMEYQHLVFEEFARKLVPSINEFIGDGINFQSDTNPAIFAEFAHQTYRLGHSMLTETIPRMRPNGTRYDISLLNGFLNPREFRNPNGGPALTAGQAAGEIFQGGTRQVGNEIDEFVTEAVRNTLLGLPLDLAVLNIARGRSEGIAPLNLVRRQLFSATGDAALEPYRDWFDLKLGLRHEESLVNFIAAYGIHSTIQAATTLGARRTAAAALMLDAGFMFGPAAQTGVDTIDLWPGGLAEKIAPFGSMLGSTFNFIFEKQLENLQNADRFYYLERLDGLNLLAQLEGNSFSELIERNTTAVGLPAEVFSRPDLILNVAALVTPNEEGIGLNGVFNDPDTELDERTIQQLVREPNGTLRYFGPQHVTWNGSPTGDRLKSSEGDDTMRGSDGNDTLEGGAGNDNHVGGLGDDILSDIFGEDVMKGGPGNDVISGGSGPFDLLQGNEGADFVIGGNDVSEVFGGSGNDTIYSGDGPTESFGGAGDDWIEGGPQLDLLVGDENNQFQDDPDQGHDVIVGGKGDDDYDSEGGDDIMVADVLGTERLEGMLGFDFVTYRGDPDVVDADMSIRVVLPPNLEELRDRFDLVEALSGWNRNDFLRGTDRLAVDMEGHELTQAGINRIAGLSAFLNGATSFTGGDIIMGGAGNDLLEGRDGDDFLDGDAWLNVQLRAPIPDAPNTFQLVDSLHALKADVIAGRINPSQVTIVRSIVTPTTGGGTDTAVFSGARANYTVTTSGSITTVVDNVGTDGTDRLRNIERLTFADGTFDPNNNPPTGAPVLSQALPQENEAITAARGTLADVDGLTGVVFNFQWQQGPVGGAAFTNIAGATAATFTPTQAQVGQVLRAIASFSDDGGTLESVPSAATGVVGDVFLGTANNDVFNGTAGRDNADGNGGNDTLTTGDADDVATGNAGNDTLQMGAGNDVANGGAGDDTINTGAGDDSIRFNAAAGFDAVNGGGGVDEIRALVAGAIIGLSSVTAVENITAAGFANVAILGSEAANTLNFSSVTITGITSIRGGGGNDVVTGSGAADRIEGGEGNDSLNGGAGADDLRGDEGTDTINGGAGADTIAGGGAADTINGDAGVDTIDGGGGNDTITGGAGNDTMNPGATIGADIFRFAAGFGTDIINGFGATASATVGQDRLHVVALGITQANFATRVTIVASGANTRITVRNADNTVAGTITLNGVAVATVTVNDFTLAP